MKKTNVAKNSKVTTTKIVDNKAALETIKNTVSPAEIDAKVNSTKAPETQENLSVSAPEETSAVLTENHEFNLSEMPDESAPIAPETDVPVSELAVAILGEFGVNVDNATEIDKAAAEKIAADALLEKTTPEPASTKKTKTQGVFQITSNFDPTVVLKGASSQIEICTRDYMSWCLKAKAPKAIQVEFDKQLALNPKLTPADVFTVVILEACPTSESLKQAKVTYGLNTAKAAETASSASTPKQPSKFTVYANTRTARMASDEIVKAIQESQTPDLTLSAWEQITKLLSEAEKILETMTVPAVKPE
jgi:hypothetical protein